MTKKCDCPLCKLETAVKHMPENHQNLVANLLHLEVQIQVLADQASEAGLDLFSDEIANVIQSCLTSEAPTALH